MGRASAGGAVVRGGPVADGDVVTSLPACFDAIELRTQLREDESFEEFFFRVLNSEIFFREDDFST